MPGGLAERGIGHVGDARGLGDDGLRGVAVRADLERIVGANLQQVGDLTRASGQLQRFPLRARIIMARRRSRPRHVSATPATRNRPTPHGWL
jgi:hypothetical protein